MWLLAASALAGAPLELRVSEGARVVALPRLEEGVVELGVYGNRAPLRQAVEVWRTPGLDHGRYVNRGGGTAFVVLTLSRPSLVPVVSVDPRDPERVVVLLKEGSPELHEAREIPSIEALLGDLPRRPAPWPDTALVPLPREGRTLGLDPAEVRLPLGEGPRTPARWAGSLGPVEAPTRDDLSRWREMLSELHDQPQLWGLAHWRLGLAHRQMGLHREAAYYFEKGGTRGFPSPDLFVGLADSALAIGEWDRAREACRQAWYREAPEETVLVCLGAVSLATAQPPPAETGRALAAVASRPLHRLLAGELLLRDGYAEEAVAVLTAAVGEDAALPLAWVALGDAALLAGELGLAQRAYLSAPHPQLDALLRVRELAVRMTQDGVRRWPSWLPDLRARAQGRDAAAADALYLLAQVHERYADPEAVAEDLARLWDLDPLSRQTDVPQRLIAACRERILQLERDRRDAELIAQLELCWREDLDQHLEGVDWLEAGARAWERLGFSEVALAVQSDATAALASIGREDALSLARLAHLQTRNGRPEHALETVAYARRLPGQAPRPELDLVAGDAHEARGESEAALAAWQAAAVTPWLASEAKLRSGMLQLRLGLCEEGAAAMAPVLEAQPVPGEPAGELEMLLARCEARLGRSEAALTHAALALARAPDPQLASEARWFAAALAARAGLTLPEALQTEAFGAVRAEDEAHAKWSEGLTDWRRGKR